jgi:hypothetical protein
LGPLVPSKKNKKMNKTKADFHESSHAYKKKNCSLPGCDGAAACTGLAGLGPEDTYIVVYSSFRP